MKFTFACKKISLNDSIKEYAEKKISKLDKYFPEEADAFVTFAVEKKNRCVVELTIRSSNGTLFRAQTEDPDGAAAGGPAESGPGTPPGRHYRGILPSGPCPHVAKCGAFGCGRAAGQHRQRPVMLADGKKFCRR